MLSEKDCFRLVLTAITSFFFIAFLLFILLSCTISFQNISTNGKASDLVDEQQEASPDVQTNLTIPTKVI